MHSVGSVCDMARGSLSLCVRGYPRAHAASADVKEVSQQMQSHYIAALVRSDVDHTEVRTS